jgi:glutamate-1-semialdehyde 2,1-aminomutase
VFSYCYHGSVDETFIVTGPDGPRSRAGNVGAPADPRQTTRVVEFNDVTALERELAPGDVAAVLMEPALTNIGIVLPEPATSMRSAPAPGSTAACSSTMRRTRSAPGPAAAPAPGISIPTWSPSASP